MPQDDYPTSQYLLWAYRLLLGREPESPQAVIDYPDTSRRGLVERFIASSEFLTKHNLPDIPSTLRRYMVELSNGRRIWLLTHDKHVSPAIAMENYEPVETAFVTRQVKKGMAVLDVGANLGWFTVHLADLVGPEGRVDAFEPRGELFELLSKTINENHLTNITLHNCALGAKNSRGQMIWSTHDVNPGGTYLDLSDLRDPQVNTQSISVMALDSSISHRIDFIKIDVEGSEPLVFRGAERILTQDRPAIMTEINPDNLLRTAGLSAAEFVTFVEGFGYQLYEILEDGSCGRHLQPADFYTIGPFVNVAMLPEECRGEEIV
jgi:FkbM family methyltransferase